MAEAVARDEPPWKLSTEMRALLELPQWTETRCVQGLIAANSEQLALMFKRETGNFEAPVRDLFREWCEHHFGRRMTAMLEGLVLFEVKTPRALIPRREPPPTPTQRLKDYLRSDRGKAVDELAAAKAVPDLPAHEKAAIAVALEVDDVFGDRE